MIAILFSPVVPDFGRRKEEIRNWSEVICSRRGAGTTSLNDIFFKVLAKPKFIRGLTNMEKVVNA